MVDSVQDVEAYMEIRPRIVPKGLFDYLLGLLVVYTVSGIHETGKGEPLTSAVYIIT